MTTMLKIENMDPNGGVDVAMVQVWAKGPDGEPDLMVDQLPLSDSVSIGIHSCQYLVIKEV